MMRATRPLCLAFRQPDRPRIAGANTRSGIPSRNNVSQAITSMPSITITASGNATLRPWETYPPSPSQHSGDHLFGDAAGSNSVQQAGAQTQALASSAAGCGVPDSSLRPASAVGSTQSKLLQLPPGSPSNHAGMVRTTFALPQPGSSTARTGCDSVGPTPPTSARMDKHGRLHLWANEQVGFLGFFPIKLTPAARVCCICDAGVMG